MKNILRKIFIIVILISIAFSFTLISNAVDDPTANEDINTPISELLANRGLTLDQNSVKINSSDNLFEMTGDNFTLDDDINGDVFVLAGGTVTINSAVTGNVFICARNVVIGESAKLESSLFCASQDLTIDGSIEKNVYTASQNLLLKESSRLGLDLFSVAQNIVFNGLISRDANMTFESIEFAENARISRNLNYSSDKEAKIPDSVVSGNVSFELSSSDIEIESQSLFTSKLISFCQFVILAIVILLISKKVDINFAEKCLNFKQNIGKYILFGLLMIFIVPILSLILLTIPVTMNLAFILMLAYIIVLLIASSYFVCNLAILCSDKLKEKLNMNETLRQVLFVVVLGIAYKLLQFVPVLGGLLTFAACILGAGMLLKHLISNKKIKAETQN